MKRINTFVLAVLLVLLCTPALAEHIVPFPVDLRLGMDETYDIAWQDGQVLIKNHSAMYRYQPGAAEAEMMFPVTNSGTRVGDSVPFFDTLLLDGDQLYAYESIRYLLTPMKPEIGNAHLGERVMLKDVYRGGQPSNWFMQGGRMYTVFSTVHDRQGKGTLTVHDAQTGAGEKISLPGLLDLCPRAAGGWLAVFQEEQDAEQAALYRMDDLQGARQRLFALPYPAAQHMQLLEDANSGRFFLLSRGTGWMVAGHVWMLSDTGEVLWKVGNSYTEWDVVQPGAKMLLTGDGRLIVRSQNAMTLYTIGEDTQRKETLYVYGVMPEDPRHARAAARMPDVRVEIAPVEYRTEALATALVSGAQTIDVFILPTYMFDLQRMAQKGWFLPLTAPADVERAQALYPVVLAPATHEGQLVGLPVHTVLETWFANASVLAKVGETVPTTWNELCALVARCQENDEVVLYPLHGGPDDTCRIDLLYRAHATYLRACAGEPLTFDTPVFRQMMEAAADIPSVPQQRLSLEGGGRVWGKPQLLEYTSEGYSLTQRTKDLEQGGGFAHMPFTLPDGTEVKPVVYASIACVNAKTALPEAAAAYVRAYFDTANDDERLLLTRQGVQPVVSEEFSERYGKQEAQLAQWQAHKDAGTLPPDTTAAQLDRRISELTAQMADHRGEYLISQAALDEYRQLMDDAQPYDYRRQNVLRNQNIWTLFNRFLDGQIDLEHYISEAGNVLRLMQAEDM